MRQSTTNGNVVLWKPSDHQVYSAKIIMDVFKEEITDGVINLVTGDPVMITNSFKQSHLSEFILLAQLKFLKIFGLKLAQILIYTEIIQELLEKPEEKILFFHIPQLIQK